MLREELFANGSIQKLPSLDNDIEEDKNNNRQISLTDNEMEIRIILDSNYDHFTTRLKQEFPRLSVADINFCCLIKSISAQWHVEHLLYKLKLCQEEATNERKNSVSPPMKEFHWTNTYKVLIVHHIKQINS